MCEPCPIIFDEFLAKKGKSDDNTEKSNEYVENEEQKARPKAGVLPQYQQELKYIPLKVEEIEWRQTAI